MPHYSVYFSAVYEVQVNIEADSPEDAAYQVKQGEGDIVDQSYAYAQDATDYVVYDEIGNRAWEGEYPEPGTTAEDLPTE